MWGPSDRSCRRGFHHGVPCRLDWSLSLPDPRVSFLRPSSRASIPFPVREHMIGWNFNGQIVGGIGGGLG